jgi:hypothetical protein
MLRRMEALVGGRAAAAPPPPAAEPDPLPVKLPDDEPLDRLRRTLLDPDQEKWMTAGQRLEIRPLILMVVDYIDGLKHRGKSELPWPAEVFGQAHLIADGIHANYGPDDSGKPQLHFHNRHADTRWEAPELPAFRYAEPVSTLWSVVTEKHSALVLFREGTCLRFPPYQQILWNIDIQRWFLSHGPQDGDSVVELAGHP